MFDIVDTPFSYGTGLIVCSSLQEFSKTKENTIGLHVIWNVDFFYFMGQIYMYMTYHSTLVVTSHKTTFFTYFCAGESKWKIVCVLYFQPYTLATLLRDFFKTTASLQRVETDVEFGVTSKSQPPYYRFAHTVASELPMPSQLSIGTKCGQISQKNEKRVSIFGTRWSVVNALHVMFFLSLDGCSCIR